MYILHKVMKTMLINKINVLNLSNWTLDGSYYKTLQISNNRIVCRTITPNAIQIRNYPVIPGSPGSGAGKGGGAGGAVRESGGALGQYGAAQEEGFFYNKQRQQLEKIKEKMKKEPQKPPEMSQKEEK